MQIHTHACSLMVMIMITGQCSCGGATIYTFWGKIWLVASILYLRNKKLAKSKSVSML